MTFFIYMNVLYFSLIIFFFLGDLIVLNNIYAIVIIHLLPGYHFLTIQ